MRVLYGAPAPGVKLPRCGGQSSGRRQRNGWRAVRPPASRSNCRRWYVVACGRHSLFQPMSLNLDDEHIRSRLLEHLRDLPCYATSLGSGLVLQLRMRVGRLVAHAATSESTGGADARRNACRLPQREENCLAPAKCNCNISRLPSPDHAPAPPHGAEYAAHRRGESSASSVGRPPARRG